jgi:signal peptidase I
VTALAVTAVVAVGLGSATGVVPFELVRIPSDSMAPTLEPGDHVVLDHRGRAVSRGDLVVVPDPQDGTLIVKRVVAVGGDMVGISDGVLEVDGRAVDEPYADRSLESGVYYGPYPVPDGRLFLLGDHRAVSVDSRAFGPVPRLRWCGGTVHVEAGSAAEQVPAGTNVAGNVGATEPEATQTAAATPLTTANLTTIAYSPSRVRPIGHIGPHAGAWAAPAADRGGGVGAPAPGGSSQRVPRGPSVWGPTGRSIEAVRRSRSGRSCALVSSHVGPEPGRRSVPAPGPTAVPDTA